MSGFAKISSLKYKYLLVVFLLLTIGGCATPYKEVGGLTFHDLGYSDKRLAKNEFQIKYFGRVWDSTSRLIDFWHKRASQLCPKGYSNTELKRKMEKKLEFNGIIPDVYHFPYVEGIATCKEN